MTQALSIVHTESSLGWGGQENRILNECVGMSRRGHRVTVITPGAAQLAERAREAGLKTEAIAMRRAFNLASLFRLARSFAAVGADVVNTHSGRDNQMAAIAARLTPLFGHRRPLVVRTRHLILPISSRFSYNVLADHVVAVSRAVGDYLASAGVRRQKIAVVPTGVDFRRFDRSQVKPAGLRAALGLPENCVLFGTIAILRIKKGHHLLIAAIEQARRKAPENVDMRFVFAGDGPQAENLAALIAEKKLNDIVFLLGLRRDIPSVLADLDCFVLPTLQEALGTSFIEAQAIGLPVIGTRVGGVPETLQEGKTGLLVSAASDEILIEQLADALLELASDPPRRNAMRQAAASFVRQSFSVEGMVEGMEKTYRELIERRP